MGFTYSNKLFGGTGSGGVSASGTGLTAGRVVLAAGPDSLTDAIPLTFDDTTDTLEVEYGTVAAANVTATALATPGAITVTPVLSQIGGITVIGPAVRATGLLTVPAAASLSDTETFSIHDGSSQQGFEFDTNSAVVNVGFLPVDLTGLVTAEDVAAACASAINGATGVGWTVEAIDNLDGTVTLRNTVFGAAGNAANAEAVGDAGFILTDMTGGADGIVDGDALSVGDGTGVVPIEFDFAPGDGTTGGAVAVVFDETDTATTLRDAVKAILDGAGRDWTTSAQGADGIGLVRATPGATGGAITEDVTDAGFSVTDWTDPTHATTVTYQLVACLADGTCTQAGADSSTALATATLNSTNYLSLSWSAVTGAASYKVYRSVAPTTPATVGIIYTGTALTVDDTGLAGGGETAPTGNGTGMATGASARFGTAATDAGAPALRVAMDGTRPGLVIQSAASVGGEKAGLVFKAYGSPTYNVQTMINDGGHFYTKNAVTVAGGLSANIAADGTLTVSQLAAPGLPQYMIAADSDLGADEPGIVARAGSVAGTFNYLGMSNDSKYTFAVDADGTIWGGAGATKASMDVSLWRSGADEWSFGAAGKNTSASLRFSRGYAGNGYASSQQTGIVYGDGNSANFEGNKVGFAGGLNNADGGLAGAAGLYIANAAGTAWTVHYGGQGIRGSKSKAIVDATPTAFATFPIADGATYGGEIIYSVVATQGTAKQRLDGRARFSATREGSTYTVAVNEIGTQTLAAAAGTLTGAIEISGTAGVVTLSANFDTSQTPDTFVINARFSSPDAGLTLTFP